MNIFDKIKKDFEKVDRIEFIRDHQINCNELIVPFAKEKARFEFKMGKGMLKYFDEDEEKRYYAIVYGDIFVLVGFKDEFSEDGYDYTVYSFKETAKNIFQHVWEIIPPK